MFGLGKKKGKEASGSSQSKRRKGSSSQPQNSSDDENEEIIQWTEKKKRLSEFNDKRVEANLWKEKMTEKGFKTEDALICENAVNSEELRMIGITQKFERIGWEAALDFCEGDHQGHIALSLIEEWMGSLSMSLGNNPPHTMTLTGTTRGGKMVMSFETMNQVALFDSLGVDHYIYPPVDQFFSNSLQDFDSVNMLNELFSRPRGQKGYSRDSMTCEGRLIQNINLENLLPRLGDRGIVRMWDARVVYSVIHGHPTFSFRYLAMLEVWESRDSYSRKSIPYPRLLTMLMKKQKAIPKGYKFHVVPVKVFDFAKLRKSGFDFEKTPQHNILRYRPSGSLITYRNDGNDGEQDDMDAMEMQGDEGGNDQNENLADTDSDQEDARRAVRMRARNQHMSDEVRAEVTVSRPTTFNTWSSYRQYMWEESTRQRVEERLRWEASERNREERDAREAANWRHLHMSREVDRYNDYVYQNQVRHHQDFTRGSPYTPHAPYVDYSTIRDQPQEVQDAVTWPENISSSHIPYPYSAPPQEAPSAQGSALNDWREFQESLFGPPNPYPPPGPYDPYFR